MSVRTSDWIVATVETLFVGGGLVVMKLFRRGDNRCGTYADCNRRVRLHFGRPDFRSSHHVSLEYNSLEIRAGGSVACGSQ